MLFIQRFLHSLSKSFLFVFLVLCTYIHIYIFCFWQVELFKHLHGLSLRWHLSRKTGEVLRVMDRGTDSINNLLNYILFSIVPTIVDILVAVIYFISAFNGWFGLIVFITMALYIGECKVNFENKSKKRTLTYKTMKIIDAFRNMRVGD